MKKHIPAFAALLLLTTALSAFFVLIVSRATFVENLRLKAMDGMFAIRAGLTPPSPTLQQIVVIGVDDESFKVMNRAWPWGRDVFAFFIEKLRTHRPKLMAFDFVFIGVGPNPKADEWLAKTIRETGNIQLASYIGPDETLMVPHPRFLEAALATGLVDKPHDVDGVTRMTRSPLQKADQEKEDAVRFSFAEQAYYRFHGADPEAAVSSGRGRTEYRIPSSDGSLKTAIAVQTDPEQRIRVSYRYPSGKFTYLSFWRVLQDKVPAGFFENKLVLIGPVSPIFHDIHRTPLGEMPGVFAMANELAALWDKDFVREPFMNYEALFVVLFGALFTLLIYRWSFAVQIIIYFSGSAILYGLLLVLFCRFNVLVDPFWPIVVMTVNFIAVASWKALKTFLDNIALQRQVITDSLTGLYGHRFLTLKLGSIFLHALQNKQEFCVGMLDADHFKKVNDTYGHDVGNQVLIGITKVMKQHVRRQDIAARFGGEEFSVVLIGTDTKGARECLERMRKAIEDLEFTSDKGKFKVTISSGLVSNQNPAVKNSDDMLKLADKALYQAKQEGRNRVCTA